mmetsp:Transcript_11251/g.14672  ORF Transcript_11251/g.14672 Transcript_11251/m.14672 type:complete len:168 (+) Transcript_11251:116-619(+)
MNFALRLLTSKYDYALRRRPLLVKSLTSGFILSLSDFTAQCLNERKTNTLGRSHWDFSWYNYKQTLASGIGYGALFFTPLMHNVFAFWAFALPSRSLAAVCFKTMVDSVVAFPMNVCALISIQTLVKQDTPMGFEQRVAEVRSILEEKLWPTLLIGWKMLVLLLHEI